MIMKKCLILVFMWFMAITGIYAQILDGQKKSYPVTMDGKNCVVSGFVSTANMSDDDAFAKTMLWVVQNLCNTGREGMNEVDIVRRSFTCDLVLFSSSEKPETYYCKTHFQVIDGKLIYNLSQISTESGVLVMKKVTPMEKLQPEKKESHKLTMDSFVEAESNILNNLFSFVAGTQSIPISHWREIGNQTPAKGMSEIECLLAFGKPQHISGSDNEVQWMYSGSFYLFFKDGKVVTIIR